MTVAASVSVPVGPRGPAGRRVLVADDNRDSADSLAVVLRALGHEVTVAYSGLQALGLALESLPHVVVLDLAMPGLSGYQVARRIRALPGGDAVGLIALSGWGLANSRHETDSGFDESVTKPGNPYELSALIFRHSVNGPEG